MNTNYYYCKMKTRHLLTAIALPALFAACTNEELLEQTTPGNVSLDDRQMVNVPAVNLNLGEQIDTRLSMDGNKYIWESTDLLGACLMDEITSDYHQPNTIWSQWFKLKDYIQTNYKFAYNKQTGLFENNALMCEGNYFFYYPYDETMNTREAFEQELEAEQKLEANADGTLNYRKTVLDNQVFLGHSAIYGDREDHDELNVSMKGVFAYPAFRIAYSSPQPVTIEKVAFKIVDNAASNTGTNVEGTVTPFNTTLKVDPTSATFNAQNPYVLADGAEYYKMIDKTTAEQISVAMPDNAACTLSSGKTIQGYVVIPAGVYDADNSSADYKSLWMYVYTNKGIVKTYLNVKNEEQEASGAPSDNVWTKGAYVDFQPDNGMLIDMGFSYEAISAPKEFTVSNTEDFELLLGWQKDQTVPTTVEATIVGEDVELSKAIYDILNNNKNLTLELTSDADATVTIPADAPANALDRVSIKAGGKLNIVNKAALTVENDFKAAQSLTNESTITLAGNSYDFKATSVTNEGTINFQAADGKVMTVAMENSHPFTNTNKGTIAVATDVNITAGGITNNGAMTINEDVTLDGKIINGANQSKDGVLNVNGAWATKWATTANYGIINVATTGSITVPSTSTFTNNENLIYNALTGALEFEGMINNSGVINGVTNNGTVEMVVKSARLTTNVASTGEIDNTVAAENLTAGTAETIYCEVTEAVEVKDLETLVKTTKASRLDISGEIKMTTKTGDVEDTDLSVTVAAVRVIGDLKINAPEKKIRFLGSTDFTIAAGTTTLTPTTTLVLGTNGSSPDGTLNIEGEGFLLINNNAEIYAKKGTGVDGNYENHGTFNVQ